MKYVTSDHYYLCCSCDIFRQNATQISGRFTSWFKFVRLERALFVYAVGLNSECKLHKPVGDHRIYIEFAK